MEIEEYWFVIIVGFLFNVMLTYILRALVKNLIKENFNIIFIRNEKKSQNINYYFFFFKKIFFN